MPLLNESNQSLLAKDVHYKDLPFKEKLEAAKEISLAAIPNILSSLGNNLKDFISLFFIGHLNNPLLFAAAGFGITWMNAFGSAIVFGFAAGFGTLASQAYGAKNYYKFGILYQKVVAVLAMLSLVICFVLYFSEAELLFFGFPADLAAEVGTFIRYLLLDLLFYSVFESTRFYLLSQNIFNIPAYAHLTSTVLHTFWCHLFVNVFGLGLLGIAIARTITDGTSATLCLLYVKLKNPCPESWFPWTPECLKDLVPFAKEIASHGSSVYVEWIAFEITTITLGYLGNVEVLAAHSAMLNYLFTNSTMSLGITLSMSIYVGNAAGEGNLAKAQKYAYTGLIVNFIIVACLDVLMLGFRNQIANFYTSEPEVNGYLRTMVTIYFFGMIGDLCCNTFAYLLRTLGQDRFILKSFIGCYYGIGVTLSMITSVWMGYGFYGVWGSLLTGCYVMLALNTVRFFKLDWSYEVKKIYNDMRKKPSIADETGRELDDF